MKHDAATDELILNEIAYKRVLDQMSGRTTHDNDQPVVVKQKDKSNNLSKPELQDSLMDDSEVVWLS